MTDKIEIREVPITEVRISKIELKLFTLITFLQTHLKIEVPSKSQSLNEYLEDVIK